MFQETVNEKFVKGFSGSLVDTAPYTARPYYLTADSAIASVVSLNSNGTVTAGATAPIGIIFNSKVYAGKLEESQVVEKGSVEVLEAGRFYLKLTGVTVGAKLYSTTAGLITLTVGTNVELTKFKVVSASDADSICVIEISK